MITATIIWYYAGMNAVNHFNVWDWEDVDVVRNDVIRTDVFTWFIVYH